MSMWVYKCYYYCALLFKSKFKIQISERLNLDIQRGSGIIIKITTHPHLIFDDSQAQNEWINEIVGLVFALILDRAIYVNLGH